MNAPPEPPGTRRPLRRWLNYAWRALGMVFLLEVGGFALSREWKSWRHNANINQIRGGNWDTTAVPGAFWYELDGSQLKFVVVAYSISAGVDRRANLHSVDLDRPYSAGKVWFNVSRTERVRVDQRPPRIFFLQGGQITSVPLPRGFGMDSLNAFKGSPESTDGARGFERWSARRP